MAEATPQKARIIETALALPLFEGLDDDTRDELSFELGLSLGLESIGAGMPARDAYASVRSFVDGETLVHQGECSTRFCVVLNGAVESSVAGGPEGRRIHRSYGPGEWFGDTSALSHHPALSSCRAVGSGAVLVIEQRLFRRFYGNDDDFVERIDEVYRREHLALHLLAATFLRDLDPKSVARLTEVATFERLDAEDELFDQDDDVESFYLVRSGGIKVVREEEDGAQRVLAFYRGNSSFGEHSLVMQGATWPGTAIAETETDLVVLPIKALRKVAIASERTMTRAGNLLLADQVGAVAAEPAQALAREEVHVMLDRQSIKGGQALVIELDKCVRCNLCVESCVAVHEDRVPRISKVGTRVAQSQTLITACYHCDVPGCMEKCGYGAIRRTPQGQIQFEYDNCVGCAQCIDGCPYGVIRLVEPFDPAAKKADFERHWLASIPFFGRLFGGESAGAGTPPTQVTNIGGSEVPVGGKTIKCDLCAGLPFEACVYNCPTSAIHRRAPESLFGGRS